LFNNNNKKNYLATYILVSIEELIDFAQFFSEITSDTSLFLIKPKKAIFGILKGHRTITLKKSKVPNILEMNVRVLKT